MSGKPAWTHAKEAILGFHEKQGNKRTWLVLVLSTVVGQYEPSLLVYPAAAINSGRKAALYALGVLHLLIGRDKKLKKSSVDPDSLLQYPAERVSTVTLLFVRHGESEWNDVFNRGFGPSFPLRLALACIREAFAWATPDSVFLDSPLSALGAGQAALLAKWLATPTREADGFTRAAADAHATLCAAPGAPPSAVSSSNLRRAVSTAAVALAERLRRTGESVHVLSSLQEISPNVDTMALSPPFGAPACSPPMRCDASCNAGNKALRGSGSDRLAAFAAWAHARPERTVVAVGHSLWFRAFVNAYLPRGAAHEARKRKIANCAVLALNLQRVDTGGGAVLFRIPPESVNLVVGKFC